MKICCICTHPKRTEIEKLLIEGRTYKYISQKFDRKQDNLRVSTASVCRHRRHTLPETPKQRPAANPDVQQPLLARIEHLIMECRSISTAAQGQKQWMAAMAALKEVRACLELLGKMSGEIPVGSVNINMSLLTEEQFAEALTAIRQRGDQAVQRAKLIIEERLGITTSPVIHVHFKKPPIPEPELLPAVPETPVIGTSRTALLTS